MRARRRTAAVVLLAVGFSALLSTSAWAQAASLTIDSRSPTLEKQDSGGWTASVAFTNLTDRALTLKLPESKLDPKCHPKLDPQELPPAEHIEVKLTIPASCTLTKHSIESTIEVPGAAPKEFRIEATEKPAPPPPNWHSLLAFPIALVALLVIAFFVCLLGTSGDGPTKRKYLMGPLKYLEATWSFADSWATNITGFGVLVAVVFSSTEVLTTLLGQDAKGPVALATVGAAIAAAVAGTAPILLVTTKTTEGDLNTVGGLIAASAVTLAAALGELFVVWSASEELSLGYLGHDLVGVAACIALALLCFYAGRSIPATIKHGLTRPPTAPSSDAINAAKMIVDALKGLTDGNEDETAQAISPHLQAIASQAFVEHRRPHRSALL